MDKNEEIYRWVAAWIKGELTPEDEAELACWLKQDPKNQEWFDTFTTRENLKGALSLYASFHTAKRWEELERYCRITNRRKIHPGYWRYVAAVVILFIIGGIGFLYFVPDTRKEMTLAAVGPKEFHQQAVLVLENGKELVLNGIKDTCLSLGQGERLWINDQGRLAYHQDSLQQETPEEWHILRIPRGGEYTLVLEALYERGLLQQNAPHLVKNQSFLIPNYRYWDNFLYTVGLTIYDILAGRLSLGRSKYVSKKKTTSYLPTVRVDGLKGGVVYHDGQFDDSRLAVNLAQSCVENGGCPINRMKVTAILHGSDGRARGVKVQDLMNGQEYEVKAKAVINATGIFVDSIMEMDVPTHEHMVKPSQGVHLVLDKSFLQSDYAIMIPKTDDGRVLFAVPWHDKVVVGTTDTLREHPELEPQALESEIEFILNTAGRYLTRKPQRSDVLSVFAGLRPLAAPKKEGKSTKEISRSHKIFVSENKLITITGGKWTTYRRMAEDTVDKAIELNLLEKKACVTKKFRIHGYQLNPDLNNHLYIYGSDIQAIKTLMQSDPAMAEKLHPKYDYTVAEVVWAVREEMALNVEDILARRVRLLFLDARVAAEVAPKVARIVAKELGYDQAWIDGQVKEFTDLAGRYILE